MALLASTSFASAEPFGEVTVGVPVSSIAEAETWYLNFLGAETEIMRPFPGVVEFKVAPDTWVQLFEVENQQPSGAIIRFLVEDMADAQRERAELGINTGDAIDIPGVVTYSEFADPFGNALGLYDLP
ncbi:VOC family protein [Litoreibacter meonggei]|nr:VOC family protein [Litoreibacter meonggei]